jgi:hypothetical protein
MNLNKLIIRSRFCRARSQSRLAAGVITAVMLSTGLWAQMVPQGAQVISYFPQLADGGPPSGQWITSLTFVNPNSSFAASGNVNFYADNGSPLSLNFGTGPVSSISFTVPAQGTVTFTSSGSSATTMMGWAIAQSTLPLEGVVQFYVSVNGVQQQGIAAQATPASQLFRSPANTQTGVAIANPSTSATANLLITALDQNGNTRGTTTLTLPPLGHDSFSVGALFPTLTGLFSNLGGAFQGSILIATTAPATYCVAWTLNVDSAGIYTNNPPSGLSAPVSQAERIQNVWQQILTVAEANFPLSNNPPTLIVDQSVSQINSFANTSQNQVDIFMNLAELLNASDSELSYMIGHEIGHVIQSKIGRFLLAQDYEQDADAYGELLSLLAGYDPYAAAGALAKLSDVSGNVDLLAPDFDHLVSVAGVNPNSSLTTRIGVVFQSLQNICASPAYQGACAQFKSNFHDHLPANAPL